jgi:hypothetical protein
VAAVDTAAATSLASRGNTTPMGSIAYMLASREYRYRVYGSNRTPPPMTFSRAAASSRVSLAVLVLPAGR